MQWYYSKNGTQLGPVAQSELISKLASGEVSPSDLVWKDGMADWIPAAQVADLRPVTSAPAPVSTVAPGSPATPYSPPVSPYAPPAVTSEVIPSYLWQSIVVTLLCCMPLGVVGIINAAKVDTLKRAGDIIGAKTASANAKKWTLIGFIIGLILNIIVFVISFLAPMMAQSTPQ